MYYTISILSKRILNFLLNIFIARLVSIQDFGEYSQFIIFSTYLLLITEFGYNEYMLVKSKKNNNLDFLIPNFLVISIFTFISIGLLLLIYDSSILLFLVFLKVYMDVFLTKLLFTYYQYNQKFKTVANINLLYCIFVLLLIISLQYSELTIENILILLNIFIFINISLFIFKSKIDFKKIDIRKNFSLLDKDILYYGFSSITIPLYMQMPLFIMTFFIQKDQIAIFYLAYTISTVMLLISVSINQQYLPKVIHNKEKSFFNIIKFPIILLVAFNISAYIFFYYFGVDSIKYILNKPEYIKSNEFILWLIISNSIQSISGLLAIYLISKGLMRKKLFLHIEIILLALLLSLILIPKYSVYGVIISYILIYFYSNIRYIFIIKKDSHAI